MLYHSLIEHPTFGSVNIDKCSTNFILQNIHKTQKANRKYQCLETTNLIFFVAAHKNNKQGVAKWQEEQTHCFTLCGDLMR
jgi:hypothetical protein